MFTTHDVGLTTWATTNPASGGAPNRSRSWPAHLTDTPTLFAGALHGALDGNGDACAAVCFQGYDTTDVHDMTDVANWTSPPLDECCVAEQLKAPSIDGGWASIGHLARMPMEEAVTVTNPLCIDLLLDPSPFDFATGGDRNGGDGLVNVYRMAVGDTVDSTACGGPCPPTHPMCRAADGECVVPVCSRLVAWCDDGTVTGLRVRNLCPHTCGCDTPRSTLALAAPVSGCPTTCSTTSHFVAIGSALPCTDSPITGNFSAFLENFYLASRMWQSNAANTVDLIMPVFRTDGCSFIQMLPLIGFQTIMDRFCFGGLYPIQPFAYFCPSSCRCATYLNTPTSTNFAQASRHCPASCASPSHAPSNVSTASVPGSGSSVARG